MRAVLISGGIALVLSLLGTPLFIRFLVRKQYGQFIRQDGPTAHFTKRGTPTMGGVVIILATLLGWGGASLVTGNVPSASAVLLLFLMTGLGRGRLPRRLHQDLAGSAASGSARAGRSSGRGSSG